MTTKIDTQDEKVNVTTSKKGSQSNTASADKKDVSGEEARISGVSYVSEQDYSEDKGDFFKALKGN